MSSSDARAAWQLPVQWPAAATARKVRFPAPASQVGAGFRDPLLKAAILFAMLALTVLDRFGLRVVGESSVPVGMMAMYGLAGAMLLTGAAEPNFRATLTYLAIASIATLSLLVNAAFTPLSFVSKMSFLLLILLYLPLCVSLRREAISPDLWRWTVGLYVAFAVFVAMAGIAQYFAQFVFRPGWLFDYTPLLPERIRATRGWNTAYTVGINLPGAWTKSNGFFMREPSIFSIVMAFGLLCELSLARRKWVMAVLGLGLVISYSGSGLLCLAVALLFPLGRTTLMRVLAFAFLAAAVFLLFRDALNLSYTVNRFDEFLVRNSSSYCRFVAPGAEAIRQINSDPWTSLLGHGPGSMVRMGGECANNWTQTTYAKVVIEYGLLGTLAFGFLMLGALNRSAAPIRIRVAAGVAWLLLGGNLLDSLHLLFIYVVSAMWPEHAARVALKGDTPHRGSPA
jgi:hypothetical protein